MVYDSISLLVLQVADSAFPIGGFAHSNGLESAMKWGDLGGDDKLQQFFRDSLMQVGRGSLPMVQAAQEARVLECVLLSCSGESASAFGKLPC